MMSKQSTQVQRSTLYCCANAAKNKTELVRHQTYWTINLLAALTTLFSIQPSPSIKKWPNHDIPIIVSQIYLTPSTKLKHHMYRRPSIDTVRLQWSIIRELLPRKDETDLIHLDPLFFLECLLYGEDLVFWFKVEGLFTTCEGFDKDLLSWEQQRWEFF